MLKLYFTLKSLRDDQRGVVSFEFIIVAACIIATVALVFTAGGNNTISGALSTGIGAITSALASATTTP